MRHLLDVNVLLKHALRPLGFRPRFEMDEHPAFA